MRRELTENWILVVLRVKINHKISQSASLHVYRPKEDLASTIMRCIDSWNKNNDTLLAHQEMTQTVSV